MWPNPQFPDDLVIFPEEILNGKLRFLCSARSSKNEPSLKISFSLYDEEMFPVHTRTESGLETAFYYFFKFQRLAF